MIIDEIFLEKVTIIYYLIYFFNIVSRCNFMKNRFFFSRSKITRLINSIQKKSFVKKYFKHNYAVNCKIVWIYIFSYIKMRLGLSHFYFSIIYILCLLNDCDEVPLIKRSLDAFNKVEMCFDKLILIFSSSRKG